MPPRLIHRFFRWFCHKDLLPGIEGDLLELYDERLRTIGKRKADLRFIVDALLLFRPGIIRPLEGVEQLNNYGMFKSYLKIGWRNLLKNKGYAFINIGGLAIGIAVASMIGLWIRDELTVNTYHKNYDRIAQVTETDSIEGGPVTSTTLPMPAAAVLRTSYGDDFKYVASTWTGEQIIAYRDNVLTKTGCFAEMSFPAMLTLEMVSGTQTALSDRSSLLLSESLARSLFGEEDPMNKTVIINNSLTQQVKGIYKDIPKSSRFGELAFLAPIDLLFSSGRALDNWTSSSFQIYTQLHPNVELRSASEKIKNIVRDQIKGSKPVVFLNPMSDWHLYEFKNGVKVAGRLQYVWLFGAIAVFVLLLACINFMNLSTARSEKRAKEVGIRKTIGSAQKQLISQFLIESLLVVTLAFLVAIAFATLVLPWFNDLSDKQMMFPWTNPVLWEVSLVFILAISLLAGSYPAFYLSSFQPIKVLKGTLMAGRLASLPRKVLVVIQFTVSVVLVAGTLIVYSQIQFVKDRPTGYRREGLITLPLITGEIAEHYEAFRQELLKTNSVLNVSQSSSPTTGIWSSADNLEWSGKNPDSQMLFGTVSIDPDFGEVVGWTLKEGHNFSKQLASDSQGFIFNEAAIQQMGLAEPVGQTIKWHGKQWNVIGVVSDMIMTSPFVPVMPTVFMMDNRQRPFNIVTIRLDPGVPTAEALANVETIFRKLAPATPFEYRFADQEYALKFAAEERIGKLASVFAALAILISCLGLFGLASFVAEQRTKEIGIRKVLGASVIHLWQMLSKEFVLLVLIACGIAIPLSFSLMGNWLLQYDYRTTLSWQLFAVAGAGAMLITLLTVSYQAIKAAVANPVRSLRSE